MSYISNTHVCKRNFIEIQWNMNDTYYDASSLSFPESQKIEVKRDMQSQQERSTANKDDYTVNMNRPPSTKSFYF